jgi:hypothetical protein
MGSESATDSRGDTPESDELDGLLAQSAAELQDLIVATRFCRTLSSATDRRCFLRDLCAFLPQADYGGQPEARSGPGVRGEQVLAEGGADVSTVELVKELQGLPNPATGRQVWSAAPCTVSAFLCRERGCCAHCASPVVSEARRQRSSYAAMFWRYLMVCCSPALYDWHRVCSGVVRDGARGRFLHEVVGCEACLLDGWMARCEVVGWLDCILVAHAHDLT